MREGAFDKRKKKPGLKCNCGLALTGVCTTGPSSQNECSKFSFFLFIKEFLMYSYQIEIEKKRRRRRRKKKKKNECRKLYSLI